MVSTISSKPLTRSIDPKREAFCADLLAKMTLEEKVGQMVQADLSWHEDVRQLTREGRISSLFTIRDPKVINLYQHIAVDESRLGIPLIIGNDIIHGFRSIFPIPLALACTWDPELVEQVARASITEAMACGTTWNFAPMVDISRDPRWGRVAEGSGEDAYLSSTLGAAWIRGYQEARDADGRSAAACVKHYAAYGASESGKDYNSVDMSERRLREEYLPPYRAAVEAGVQTLMTSFNDLNGVPASANSFLIKRILREEWGFEGVVVSDYDAIGELVMHGFARDHKEATLRSVLAGVDMDMMGNAYHFHLAALVREGKVAETVLDEAVLRILGLKYDLGLFEHPFVDEADAHSALSLPESLDLAAKAAAQSIVLLKNEGGILPLNASAKTVALIGPLAKERQSLLGCWCFDGRVEDVETLAEVLERDLPADTNLIVEQGCAIDGGDLDLAGALKAAALADVVLLALGESDTMSGEAHSRAHLCLPGRQQELADALAKCGKPVVALVFAGRPLVMTKLVEETPSVVMAWHGGTRAARGVADVLTGKVNPSGKLSISFPRSEGQIPVYYAHKNTGRPVETSGTVQFNQAHKSSYLDEENAPLFPFGFGLSYAQFDYSGLKVLTPQVRKNETLRISARVTNSGKWHGSEIVQLYVRDLVGVVTRPVKELVDFRKIALAPGDSQTVEFELPAGCLSFLDENHHPVLEEGDYKVWIGPNSAEGLEGRFELID